MQQPQNQQIQNAVQLEILSLKEDYNKLLKQSDSFNKLKDILTKIRELESKLPKKISPLNTYFLKDDVNPLV